MIPKSIRFGFRLVTDVNEVLCRGIQFPTIALVDMSKSTATYYPEQRVVSKVSTSTSTVALPYVYGKVVDGGSGTHVQDVASRGYNLTP